MQYRPNRLQILSAIAVLALAIPAVAAKSAKPAKAGVHGTVASIDAGANSLVVHPKKGADVTVTTTDATSITVDGKKATLGDLTDGEKIHAKGTMEDGKLAATSVAVTAPKSPKPKKARAAAPPAK